MNYDDEVYTGPERRIKITSKLSCCFIYLFHLLFKNYFIILFLSIITKRISMSTNKETIGRFQIITFDTLH